MKSQIKLVAGDKLGRSPNEPILSIQHGFIWIGNNAEGDMACFGTYSGKKKLLALAKTIRQAAIKLKDGHHV